MALTHNTLLSSEHSYQCIILHCIWYFNAYLHGDGDIRSAHSKWMQNRLINHWVKKIFKSMHSLALFYFSKLHQAFKFILYIAFRFTYLEKSEKVSPILSQRVRQDASLSKSWQSVGSFLDHIYTWLALLVHWLVTLPIRLSAPAHPPSPQPDQSCFQRPLSPFPPSTTVWHTWVHTQMGYIMHAEWDKCHGKKAVEVPPEAVHAHHVSAQALEARPGTRVTHSRATEHLFGVKEIYTDAA
jgi:hypothetical protein